MTRGDGLVRHVHSLGAETVALPPLTVGATFFSTMALREVPMPGIWRAPSYTSSAPALFVVENALLQSSPGLLLAGGRLCRETLDHTDPARHGYQIIGDAAVLMPGKIERIDEPVLSLLSGANESLFHWLLDGVARLGVVREDYLRAARILLVPGPAAERYPDLLARLSLPDGLRVRPVQDGETLQLRTLIQPTSVSAGLKYHPCLVTVARALARDPPADLPRRFYVDRRRSRARPLANETPLVEALAAIGIPAIALEERPVSEQIALFAGAELVVAPHGAGLAHLAYAGEGCRVLELLMDSYAHYGFRTLAAVKGLDYDCVFGRSLGQWPPVESAAIHAMPWQVSIPHVMAAVAHLGGRLAQS